MGEHPVQLFPGAGETEGAGGDWSFSCPRKPPQLLMLCYNKACLYNFPAIFRL